MAVNKLKAPRNIHIDFSPSPRQYELWKLLQPNYCPHCGAEIEQVLVDYDNKKVYILDEILGKPEDKENNTPALARKVDETKKPVTDWQLATFQNDYNPYHNPWMV